MLNVPVVVIFVMSVCFSCTYALSDYISDDCGEHEYSNNCTSPCALIATCQNRNPMRPPGQLCTTQCVKKCLCEKGYIRDEVTKKCVRTEDCPYNCGKHASFNECTSACQLIATCQNRSPSRPQGEVCTKQCVGRCLCSRGYILDEVTKKCVKIEDCPNSCGANAYLNECSSACPLIVTCQNRNPMRPPGQFCTTQCVQRCLCKKGYIRDEVTKKCVKIEDCTKPRGPRCYWRR